MSRINKQKFLAELKKLLAFMKDTDREAVLAMYAQMFDEAADEKLLLRHLVSPTRQAVIVARAYDAKKPSVKETEAMSVPELPDYAKVVTQIQNEARAEQTLAVLSRAEEQLESEEKPAEPEETESAEEPVETAEEPSEETSAQEETESEGEPVGSEEEPATSPEEEPSVEETVPETAEPTAEPETVRKARVPLLILYILIAVPLGLVGTVLLLVPALLFLVLAVGVTALGVFGVSCAFGGLAIFADIMIVVGAVIILFALALLFLWIFVWFIGGAITGLIWGLIRLGRKWCYKEVPAV